MCSLETIKPSNKCDALCVTPEIALMRAWVFRELIDTIPAIVEIASEAGLRLVAQQLQQALVIAQAHYEFRPGDFSGETGV